MAIAGHLKSGAERKAERERRVRERLEAMYRRWDQEEAAAHARQDVKRQPKILTDTKRQRLLKAFARKHSRTLFFKRRALMAPDEYGRRNQKGWNMEINLFLSSVLPRQLRPKTGEAMKRARKIVLEAVNDFATKTRANPQEPDDPIAFERFCAEALRKEGWATTLTKRTGDQGVDVIAQKAGRIVALQCKLYSQPVGNKAVQEAFSGAQFVGANAAVVVTNASFTRSAQQLANSLGVHLIHYSELCGLESKLAKRDGTRK